MLASLSFFPEGNGDMTLDLTKKDNTMLINLNIPAVAYDSGVPTWIFNDLAKSMDATPYRN